MKVVIVGGVAGGMSTATRLRRRDESAQIVVLERGEHVSFANCGLPYYVGGVIEERQALLLQTPQSLAARFRIDVRTRHEVVDIDRENRTVRVRDLSTGTESLENYDSLILSPGASPFVPDFPGAEQALRLRDIADVDRMTAAVAGHPRTALVMGAGFIGVEMAENLVERGIKVTLVEMADQVLAPLDPEMAVLVHHRLTERGVDVHLGSRVTAFSDGMATLSSGQDVPADLLVAAIGVRAESGLAVRAGLEVNERGGIVVDDRQRTSDPHIYAVGDAAQKRDFVDGGAAMVPLAQTANRHGRLVADVITGRETHAQPVLGTAIVGVFGLQVAATGWNEKRLRAAGRRFRAIHTHPADHAGYYPGAQGMSLKLLVDPETDAILGAQGVGAAGVDKRIDVIATAMRGQIAASELADLELAYAPQFGSAKDPVNMLGFVADNLASGMTEAVQWHELDAMVAAGAHVLDVRTPGEYAAGAIPGAVLIPVDELRDRLDEVPEGDLIVHCAVGLRGHIAVQILGRHGRAVRHLDGGYRTWRAGQDALSVRVAHR
ncbi:NADPH-dependent 2,4-dienoyl-CoA reductase, sulfur reductase [Austwickia chelonae]|uniref:Pyridine nucleotide-disulphide oxidoreductase family protein n=1 Tax=Austwickia chelonae NBRC 105200 TaxID=1184607 RepID=K6V862_9MICO|nr:FAD-dependent oxidoreductase [Austwickia chelonae]GAB78413.1 pyridine nucleotide-disulphide oxidoreductase family protein [Austwickia chelonae NBRC 105200]SEW39329.1 NADPH-dependent 2,4-dienoyl-CoA reductase, sulfur reductase [Austwickia chelonae]